MLVLSFPPSYLGDKRTAFGQSLSLTLGFPMFPAEVDEEVRVQLEVTSFVSIVEPPLVLEFEVKVDVASAEPQPAQVGVVFLWVWSVVATSSQHLKVGVVINGRGQWIQPPLSPVSVITKVVAAF